MNCSNCTRRSCRLRMSPRPSGTNTLWICRTRAANLSCLSDPVECPFVPSALALKLDLNSTSSFLKLMYSSAVSTCFALSIKSLAFKTVESDREPDSSTLDDDVCREALEVDSGSIRFLCGTVVVARVGSMRMLSPTSSSDVRSKVTGFELFRKIGWTRDCTFALKFGL